MKSLEEVERLDDARIVSHVASSILGLLRTMSRATDLPIRSPRPYQAVVPAASAWG